MDKKSNQQLAVIGLTKDVESVPARIVKSAEELRNYYPTSESFLKAYNSGSQDYVASHLDWTYMGDAPTLNTVRAAYTDAIAKVWIMAQLENLNDYTSVKEKMIYEQMDDFSSIVLTDFSFLKVSELLLFFHRFKAGAYGQFYGAVDPLVIATALREFMSVRAAEITKFENDRRQKEAENRRKAEAGQVITREEYLRRKKENEASLCNNSL